MEGIFGVHEQLPYVIMQKGFEVCGSLSDVYVSTKRNIQGLTLGFVRLGKVKDEAKLEASLNNVQFGHYQVWLRLARF